MTIIQPVSAAGRLDQVLNSFLHSLSLRTLEQVATPTLSAATLAALDDNDVAYLGELFWRLAAVNNSLHQLANCLLAAHFELELFKEECAADLDQYARYKQQEAAGPAGRRQLSTRLVKPTSLLPFSLKAVLAPCFVGHRPSYVERIGTSQPSHFSYHSSLLADDLLHGLRDPSRPATPSNLTTRTRAEVLALGLLAKESEEEADRWVGYDTSLSGPEAAAAFNQLLRDGQQAAALYHCLALNDAEGFSRLYQLLETIIDGI